MESSLATILEPANRLISILFLPRVAYFCGFFAYTGLKNGDSLTHFGMRKGAIARIYGVLYFLVLIIVLIELLGDIRNFLAYDLMDIQKALLYATPLPEMGFFFLGLSVFLFLFSEGLIRFGLKKRSLAYKNLIAFNLCAGSCIG